MTQRLCTLPPTGKPAQHAQGFRAALPEFSTERLTLRAPNMSDYPTWATIFAEERDGNLGGPHSDEDTWYSFAAYAAGWLLHGYGMMAITDTQSGKTLGFVMLGLEWGDAEPELGWLLPRKNHGFGYATEAATAMRDYAASLLGDGKFVSYIHHGNSPSARVAARLGATRDAAAEKSMPCQVWRHMSPTGTT